MERMAASAPRTLTEQLRTWSEDQLARLLELRPDLAAPVPQDTAQLVSRAVTRASVLRALERLTLLELTVLEAVGAGSGSPAEVARVVHADETSIATALVSLRELALLWGTDDTLRLVSVVPDLIGTGVTGLGPPSETDAARVPALVEELDAPARAMLEHLVAAGPVGTVGSTEAAPADSPVGQLLSRGLVVRRDSRHVVVPREVGLALRGGHTTREPVDLVPALVTSERDHGLVDRAAAGAAFELVRRVTVLLEHWSTTPPAVLRGGGLGVRDLKAAAQLLHLEVSGAALHIEVAAAAGLLAVGPAADHEAAWLPTDAFDLWAAGGTSERWLRLAEAWLATPRLVGLIGGRENGKPVNALAPGLERSWSAETSRTTLEQLATLAPGQVLAAGTGVPSLVDRLAWLRPRRPAARAQAVGWAVTEAAVLGLLGLGGVAGHGRALLDDPPSAVPVLEGLLPDPVDHVLLQADLTAVAPGPLEHQLAHDLALVADVESRGGATVYRFSAASLRRAYDAGWSAGRLHTFLADASRTPVPQPLTYLVDEAARKFGTLRVGAVESFLRSEDEAALAELEHHPRAGSLRLRRIAPTVLVSDVPVDVLLPRLRDLGAAPVVEGADGTVRTARRDALRAPTPKPRAPEARDTARRKARVAAAVTAIRAGDEAARHRPAAGSAAAGTPTAVLAALNAALDDGRPVWVRYLDNHGSVLERVVKVRRVDAGSVMAYDARSDSDLRLAVHRITAVQAVL